MMKPIIANSLTLPTLSHLNVAVLFFTTKENALRATACFKIRSTGDAVISAINVVHGRLQKNSMALQRCESPMQNIPARQNEYPNYKPTKK